MAKYWDPLRKAYVEATPEEKVRQWFIERLHQDYGIPYHRMNSEVSLKFGSKPFRADIVVFDQNGNPEIIVECKRPEVPLTEEVLRQAQRYSAVLPARSFILTNGLETKRFDK